MSLGRAELLDPEHLAGLARNPSEHGLEAVERTDETIQDHVCQYLLGESQRAAFATRGACEHSPASGSGVPHGSTTITGVCNLRH